MLKQFGYMVAAVLSASALVACSGAEDKWMGSVDAVFRYRPGDRSTVIHEVRPGTKSEASGLETGDRVIAVDGKEITEMSYEQVRASLRGPVGTFCVLTVERGGLEVEVRIERRPLDAKEGSGGADGS